MKNELIEFILLNSKDKPQSLADFDCSISSLKKLYSSGYDFMPTLKDYARCLIPVAGEIFDFYYEHIIKENPQNIIYFFSSDIDQNTLRIKTGNLNINAKELIDYHCQTFPQNTYLHNLFNILNTFPEQIEHNTNYLFNTYKNNMLHPFQFTRKFIRTFDNRENNKYFLTYLKELYLTQPKLLLDNFSENIAVILYNYNILEDLNIEYMGNHFGFNVIKHNANINKILLNEQITAAMIDFFELYTPQETRASRFNNSINISATQMIDSIPDSLLNHVDSFENSLWSVLSNFNFNDSHEFSETFLYMIKKGVDPLIKVNQRDFGLYKSFSKLNQNYKEKVIENMIKQCIERDSQNIKDMQTLLKQMFNHCYPELKKYLSENNIQEFIIHKTNILLKEKIIVCDNEKFRKNNRI